MRRELWTDDLLSPTKNLAVSVASRPIAFVTLYLHSPAILTIGGTLNVVIWVLARSAVISKTPAAYVHAAGAMIPAWPSNLGNPSAPYLWLYWSVATAVPSGGTYLVGVYAAAPEFCGVRPAPYIISYPSKFPVTPNFCDTVILLVSWGCATYRLSFSEKSSVFAATLPLFSLLNNIFIG